MATRVLIIHRQLVFAVTIKQALEQTGLYDVHPFTTADAALTFLRDHPQDVAVVDYLLPGRSGSKIVQQLRAIQSDLAVIISPYQPRQDVEELNIQGMLDVPFSARDLIQLLRELDPSNADQPISTRRFDPEPGQSAGQTSTRPLPEEDLPPRRPFGTTNLLNKLGGAPLAEDNPAQTRDLSGEQRPLARRKPPAEPSRSRADTQKFDDDPASDLKRSLADTDKLADKQPSKPGQTKRFAEEWPTALPDSPPSTQQLEPPPATPGKTRDLDDKRRPAPPQSPVSDFGRTRDLDAEGEPPPATPGKTRDLDDKRRPAPRQQPPPVSDFGRTRDLDAEGEPPPATPGKTRDLDDKRRPASRQQPPPVSDFGRTRDLDAEGEPPPAAPAKPREAGDKRRPAPRQQPPPVSDFGRTRDLDAEGEPPPAAPAKPREAGDKRRPTPSQPPVSDFGRTRDLDAEGEPPPAAPAKPRDAGDKRRPAPPQPSVSSQTRQLDMDAPPFPPGFGPNETQKFDDPTTPPKATSGRLNEVLKSFEIEPPFQEGDTPNVPIQDSDAVRQFLATARSVDEAEAFDNVLGSIAPEDEERPRSRRHSDFEGLVQSMRSDEPHRTLPNRQQQMMDFILSTGMDSVLEEIEKTKTGPLVAPPSLLPEEKPRQKAPGRMIDRLAQEEPPMPTLEESGTVSDLLTGINESEFRNVLSMLSGTETDLDEPPPPPAATTREKPLTAPPSRPTTAATGRQRLSEEQEDPAQIRPIKPPPKKGKPKAPQKPPQKKQAVPDFFFQEDEPDEGATVAQVVLSATLDDKRPPESAPALDKLISDIENRLAEHKLNIRPLPSWDMDTTAFRAVSEGARLAEPSFLPEELPPGEMIPPTLPEFDDEQESYTGRTTRASHVEYDMLDTFAEDDETVFDDVYLEDTAPSKPLRAAPVVDEPPVDESDSVLERAWADFFAGVDAQQTAQDSWEAPDVDDLLGEQTFEEQVYDEQGYEDESFKAAQDAQIPAAALDDFDWPRTPAQPDFAPETLPETLDEDDPERYGDQQPDFIEAMLREQDFAPIPDVWQDEPTADEAWQDEPAISAADDAWALSPVERDWDEPSAPVDDWALPAESVEPAPALSGEEAIVAQLALNLTQVSLELSAEATLLSKFGEIIAFAGHLSQEDTHELRQLVQDDWDAVADGARVRFITLPSSGREYMLYSIRAQDDLTLSMIFAGATPLRIIRKQAQRLIDALQSVPEAPAPVVDSALAVEAEAATLTSYSFLWLLHEGHKLLSEAVIQALRVGLTTQLRELGWVIDGLDVREDYIYLLANIPGETPSHQLMRDLKRRSAEIAHAQNSDITPQTLWSDGYFILTPGRALAEDEIAEFIHFQRMG
jgi:DNA-binding NarL/FixJ family response regulator/REP element-mobilizing transposase RayT